MEWNKYEQLKPPLIEGLRIIKTKIGQKIEIIDNIQYSSSLKTF